MLGNGVSRVTARQSELAEDPVAQNFCINTHVVFRGYPLDRGYPLNRGGTRVVLIPTSITALDLGSTMDCVEMCHKACAPCLVVINNVTHYDAPAVREARRGLIEMRAKVDDTVIRCRVPYYDGTIAGLTALERSRDAKSECRGLWTEIVSKLPSVGGTHGQ